MFRSLTVALALLTLVGCKLLVTSGTGGTVEYSGGSCGTCEIEILDATFDETFTAVPADGYVFSHWLGGEGYQCPGSPDPECVVSNTQFAENAGAEAHIASDKTYYLEAVYRTLPVRSPILVDAAGQIIGVPNVGDNTGKASFWVNSEGNSAYVIVYAAGFIQENYVYFDEPNCNGTGYIPTANGSLSGIMMAGTYKRLADNYAFYVPNNEPPVSIYSVSRAGLGGCLNLSGPYYQDSMQPATPFDTSFNLPLRVEMR